GFKWSSDLVAHQRIYTGEWPYECPECGKMFRSCGDLTKQQPLHTGEREALLCPDCGKGFKQNSHLSRDRFVHTGERPFECPEGGKS
ncbi:ZN728 protein, partial [Dasyornis broadbenti]|nr:ZN728 protein [Dasyornis broadbenti]